MNNENRRKEDSLNFIEKHWQVLSTLVILAFLSGGLYYTVNKLEARQCDADRIDSDHEKRITTIETEYKFISQSLDKIDRKIDRIRR
jgi:hypothetical protein